MKHGKFKTFAQSHAFGDEAEIQTLICLVGIHSFPTAIANLL